MEATTNRNVNLIEKLSFQTQSNLFGQLLTNPWPVPVFTYLLPPRAILEAMPQLDLALSPQNDARHATILALPPQIEADILPADVSDAIRSLGRDLSIQEAVRRSCEFQLNDSAIYYFSAMDRMASPSYLPTDQDILRSRVKTTGITETTFKVGELTYKLFDVGGQRSERKKQKNPVFGWSVAGAEMKTHAHWIQSSRHLNDDDNRAQDAMSRAPT